MLRDLLKNKNCFKLICAAGNENTEEVEKLVTLYAKAGCRFFDIAATPEVLLSAKRGIERAETKEKCFICVSVGTKGDPHFNKAVINSAVCSHCRACEKICPQNAVENFQVDEKKCIGCAKCIDVCAEKSIELRQKAAAPFEILPTLIKNGIDCIEFHALSNDEDEVLNSWLELNSLYDGVLSICLNRSKFGNEKLIELLKKMLAVRKPDTTIIQADGAPMTGGKNDFKTTLQAVATAELLLAAKLPAFILLSGGTNSKSAELAELCDVDINGIAVGSFARNIVKEFVSREDFFQNETVFNQALKAAKNLVESNFHC